MEGLADRLEICRLMDSTLFQPRSCCSLKDTEHSVCNRLEAWKGGHFAKQLLDVIWVQPRDSADSLPGTLRRCC